MESFVKKMSTILMEKKRLKELVAGYIEEKGVEHNVYLATTRHTRYFMFTTGSRNRRLMQEVVIPGLQQLMRNMTWRADIEDIHTTREGVMTFEINVRYTGMFV